MSAEGTCLACGSGRLSVFAEWAGVPVHCSTLWRTREAALACRRGDIRLAFCSECGFIANTSFDPTLVRYAPDYENSLHFSPLFQAYSRALAARLVEQYGLRGKTVIDIGCGKGEFLSLLCKVGGNRGFGFDPAFVEDRIEGEADGRVTVIRDLYSERYANYQGDFVCCRHTLEHVPDPRAFLAMVRRNIGDRSDVVVFFEVPNVLFTLRDGGIWDIIYEHCSYFSRGSLERLFASCEFRLCDSAEAFAGQFLCIEALPGDVSAGAAGGDRHEIESMTRQAHDFEACYRTKVETWNADLDRMTAAGRRVVVWGAGSKGVTFLNTLQLRDEIEHIVDINPHKQGAFVAGTGQKIMAPEFLRDYRPDAVIVMNPAYVDEVRERISGMGLSSEIVSA